MNSKKDVHPKLEISNKQVNYKHNEIFSENSQEMMIRHQNQKASEEKLCQKQKHAINYQIPNSSVRKSS